jgi:L-asparaginase / beta-aspartyl-peptidase
MMRFILTNEEGHSGTPVSAEALRAGRSALDAVEAGIREVERDPNVRSVGYGGAPNLLGQMECDASIMCGRTQRTGAVGALQGFLHAISAARKVMERTPHVMLVGDGAARFAAEMGLECGEMLSPEAREAYERWKQQRVPAELRSQWPNGPMAGLLAPTVADDIALGTTCFLARDGTGDLAGGVSTSGWAYKYPGRLGDSPIIGAGLYVDNRFGAAACTHTGEMAVRAGTSRAVVAYMKKGATVRDACLEALDDLRHLKGGFLGSVVIHAVDATGTPHVVCVGMRQPAQYRWWADGMRNIEQRVAEDF